MGSIHVRIGHDNDLVIAELTDIKVIAVALGKTTAKGVNHGLDLRIGQDLIDAGLLHVQDLTPDGQDGLEVPVPGRLGGAACGISLYDKNLAFGSVPTLAIGQLSVGIKGILLFGQKVRLGPLLGFPDLRCFLRTADDAFQNLQIPVKIPDDLVSRHFGRGLGGILVVQLGLGLAFETGCGVLDGDHGGHAVPHR